MRKNDQVDGFMEGESLSSRPYAKATGGKPHVCRGNSAQRSFAL
jgi:hypothetical protein